MIDGVNRFQLPNALYQNEVSHLIAVALLLALTCSNFATIRVFKIAED